jgi:uncharacterized protein YecT (DUF1311 family)
MKAFIFFIAMLIPLTALGAEDQDQLQACLDRPEGQTTYGMKACIAAERDRLEARLKSSYQAALAGETRNRRKLETAQQAWEKFSYSDCGYAYSRGGNGTISGVLSGSCATEQTQRRIDELSPRGMEDLGRQEPPSVDYERCAKSAANPTGRSACLSAQLARDDRSLNDAYRKRLAEAAKTDKFLGKDSAGERSSLVAAERAWIAYRDAQCGYLSSRNQGSDAKQVDLRCRIALTGDRTTDLSRDQ